MSLLMASDVSAHPSMAGDLVNSSVEVCLVDSGTRALRAKVCRSTYAGQFCLAKNRRSGGERVPGCSLAFDLAQLACIEPRRSGRDYSVGRAGRTPVTSQLITPALMRLVQQHDQAAIEVELKARSYFLCIQMNGSWSASRQLGGLSRQAAHSRLFGDEV